MLKKKYDLAIKQYIISIIVFAYIYKQLNVTAFNRPLEMYECVYFSFKNQFLMNVNDLYPSSEQAKMITCLQNFISVMIILYQL